MDPEFDWNEANILIDSGFSNNKIRFGRVWLSLSVLCSLGFGYFRRLRKAAPIGKLSITKIVMAAGGLQVRYRVEGATVHQQNNWRRAGMVRAASQPPSWSQAA